MALTTRRFVLRHVIDNSSGEETVQTKYHLGYRWTTKVTANCPYNRKEIDLQLIFPDAGLVGKHADSEIWVSTRFLDANGKVTYKRKHPDVFGTFSNSEEREEEGENVENEEDDDPECFIVCDGFKKKKIGLIKKTDVVTMELHIKVKGEFPVKKNIWDFTNSSDLTDLVLKAEGKKFHVNKAILALQSSQFHDLLYREGSSEVELKDLSSETLQDLLEVIYHSSNISESNLRPLLEAARTYGLKLVTEQCRQFLITNNKMEKSVKKWVAAKFCLGDDDLTKTPKSAVKRDFSKADPVLTDMVLVVQGKKFHVNKAILATFSTYFYSMFYSGFQESEQSEIELKGIEPEAFQQLLEVIYHCPNIHENNVENLLELARMYDVQPAITQCEKFLMGENKLEREEKRRLTEEYGLIKLEEEEPAAKKPRVQ